MTKFFKFQNKKMSFLLNLKFMNKKIYKIWNNKLKN